MIEGKKFLVERANIHNHSVHDTVAKIPQATEGEIIFKVDHFAFTANNITYAAFGDVMKYWDFFPVSDELGCVPVWGFADVIESNCDGIQVGERFYGYFPMATHLRVTPSKISQAGFADASPHRAHLSTIYNYYINTATDTGYASNNENLQMLFRPLFMTSFLIDDFLDDNAFFGAKQVVLSSASSKTAYGLAFLLAQRKNIKITGLTSASNMPFVNGLGLYTNAVTYDKITTLDPNLPTVFVDMAGSGEVRSNLHHHFNNNLSYSCSVGASHWDQMGSNDGLPGAKPTLFFAPDQAKKRNEEWGLSEMQKRSGQAWLNFIEQAGRATHPVRQSGDDAISKVYDDTLSGKTDPKYSYILGF